MAIRWVAEAWDSVQEETIRKCLTKSGITGSGFSVHRLYEDEDPLDDVEAQEELHELLERISLSDISCPVEEYIDGEGDVPTCMQYNNNMEDHFFANLGSSQAVSDSLVQEDPDDEGQVDLEPPPPKITRFQDAISSLEEVQSFLDWRGFSQEAIMIASSMNKLTHFHCESLNSARQTTLDDYFHSIYLILYYSTPALHISNILLLSLPCMYMFWLYLPHLMIIFILCNIILLSIPCMYMFCQLYKITPEMWPPLYKGQRVDPEWWPL